MRITLERLEATAHGTFGRLYLPDCTLFTGELPWRDNKPNISCIPKGVYDVVWSMSPRFRKMLYLVTAVPNRTGIRFHAANLMGDVTKGLRAQLNGCIALGEKLGSIENQKALLVSAPAMRRFETMLAGRPFKLEIR